MIMLVHYMAGVRRVLDVMEKDLISIRGEFMIAGLCNHDRKGVALSKDRALLSYHCLLGVTCWLAMNNASVLHYR